MRPPDVLFLCTMNYYRSRFAHIYFNHLSRQTALRADSRGLMVDQYHLTGLSQPAQEALRKAGVTTRPEDHRDPILATPHDLETARCVIALYRREHEPMVLQRYRAQRRLVAYWDIQDLDEAPSHQALPQCQALVQDLFARLQAEQARAPADRARTI